MNTARHCLLTLLATAACACGRNTPEHTCRILFLDRPDDAPRTLHLFDGVSPQMVELPRMNLSPVYKLRPAALCLRLLPAPAVDPKTVSPDAPSVAVPESHANFHLVFAMPDKNRRAPRVFAFSNFSQPQDSNRKD